MFVKKSNIGDLEGFAQSLLYYFVTLTAQFSSFFNPLRMNRGPPAL